MQVDDLKGIMVRNIGEPLMSFPHGTVMLKLPFFMCNYERIMILRLNPNSPPLPYYFWPYQSILSAAMLWWCVPCLLGAAG